MRLVTRTQWGARTPKKIWAKKLLGKPTGHWNGPLVRVSGKTTWDHSKCPVLVRSIQNFHMDGRGWNDIAYNFVVCPHEYVFEGRGINVVNGANGTNSGNQNNHAIMWLAGQGNAFVPEEKRAFKDVVSHLSKKTGSPNSAMGHRDHKATACPGDARYSWIRSGMPTSGSTTKPPPTPPTTKPSTVLTKRGSKGNNVKLVQGILGVGVDGIFGPATEAAVKRFQKSRGLAADGIVGPDTWKALAAKVKGNHPTTQTRRETVRRGSKGSAVRTVQQILKNKANARIAVDGVFGPATESAVRKFQRSRRLSSDGIVGPKTWNALIQINSK